jgi:molecular chaperone GrpE (heat shock protein)
MNLYIREKEIENIILEHLLKVKELEEITCRMIRNEIEQLLMRILLMVNQSLKNDHPSRAIEKTYYVMQGCKNDYLEGIKVLDRVIDESQADEFLDICTGLRLTMSLLSDEVPEIEEENPIAYERLIIISSHILKMKNYMIKKLETQGVHCSLGQSVTKTELLKFIGDSVVEFFAQSYDIFEELLNNASDELGSGQEAIKYEGLFNRHYDQIKSLMAIRDEHIIEVFEVINKIWSRLEHEKHRKDKEALKDEGEVIDRERVLNLVEEHLLIHTDELEGVLDFAQSIHFNSIKVLRDMLMEDLIRAQGQTLNASEKESLPVHLVSSQVIMFFESLLEELVRQPYEAFTVEGQKIMEGIMNTLHLKYDSLKEKDSNYHMDKQTAQLDYEKQFIRFKEKLREEIETYFLDALMGEQVLMKKNQATLEGLMKKILKDNHQQDVRYLQKELLFELQTYDEILRYALPKLSELEEDKCQDFIKQLNQLYHKCLVSLEKQKIKVIDPQPHTPFDGKIHEVLLAQEEEGFSKGEVIRSHSVGYQFGDEVIIRATVIGAK